LLLITPPRLLLRLRARPPQADQPGDERDQEELAGQHFEHSEDLADVARRHQVAVPRRRSVV